MLILKLALRNVLRNRRRSLLTIISMGGGYFLLSVMAAMTEGSYSNMIDLFTRDHTGHVQVHYGNYLTRPSLYKTINQSDLIISNLMEKEQVIAAAPRIYGPSLAYGKSKSFPANVIGIHPDYESRTTLLSAKLQQGVFIKEGMNADGYYPAMIGVTLSKNLNVTLGDELILISQGIDGSIANDIFQISGIVGTETSHERLNVYLSLSAMSQFLSMGNQVHEIAIRLQHQDQAIDFVNKMDKFKLHRSLTYEPWQVVESAFFNGMKADKTGNYVSMGIIIFIVAIGVLNAILMSTLERTHEFGILKAIGTRPMGIFRLILLESSLLALASCFIGACFSLPVNYWMAAEGIPMPTPIDMGGVVFETMLGEVSVFSMGMPTLVVLFSTLLVSVVPAMRASQISPTEAMRN